jgi:Rrf2 family protein
MRLSAQEEYGLRCMLRIAREGEGASLTIPMIGSLEGLSISYVAKLMRLLRRGGFVTSSRGQAGGYTLARPADQIVLGEALAFLGGRLYEPQFCEEHSGMDDVCAHSMDCSVRSLWRTVQAVVDQVLSKTTLKELLANEQEMTARTENLVQVSGLLSKGLSAPLNPAQ